MNPTISICLKRNEDTLAVTHLQPIRNRLTADNLLSLALREQSALLT